ncbi:lipopolysaccharide biosynthesis protein [Lujinxingia vulgaris]|uniref:Lipopolysaccharide biosynthesis protein n=1 Tax=Lujinxingia vulgaris TaxID=2600176 RepID=A0A5C6XHI9_9DELT|nr:lipopolysaccharide biosynthesis protein [Lujinxingia vulgaris]TXD41175.1 lipopolysaccharide biosynthesis protein [Lujinxingia vulgaris]
MPRQNPETYISTDHLHDDLEGQSVRGGTLTAIAQILKSLLEMGSTFVLARLIAPEDFGLFGMVIIVTGFLTMFKDLGLAMATIQRENITHAQVSALFWINLLLGALITLVTAGSSWVLAWVFDEPRLVPIALGLAGAFFFGGLTVQHEALLRRQMRFGRLAAVEVSAMAISVGLAVAVALAGGGYWALVVNSVALAVASCLGVWIACGWRPARPAKASGLRSMLAFGADMTGFNFVNYFARNFDDFLIGRFHGAQQLGFYQMAYKILMIPLRQINHPVGQIAIPALSRVANDPARYRQMYLRVLENLLLVTMPLGAILVAGADWLILSVLGDAWGPAIPIFAALGLSIFTQTIGNTTGWLFVSQDRTRELFHWGLLSSGLVAISFALGIYWGALGVAIAYTALGIVLRTPLLLWFVTRQGPIKMGDFYRTAFIPFSAALGGATALLAQRIYLPIESPVANVALAIPTCLLGALLVLGVLPAGRRALRDLINLIGYLRAGRDISESTGEPSA